MDNGGLLALGVNGSACVGMLFLVSGARGAGRLRIKQDNIIYASFGVGLLVTGTASAFAQVGTVGDTLSKSMQTSMGGWGLGATAALMLWAGFGLSAKPWKDIVCGLISPGAFLAAGGVWAIVPSIFGNILRSLVGA
ncbi:hypothetical protein ACGF0D_43055 [Kitasatospora sp. NPDC048298]|uniref:hypothetical protein n=1 Tax=Kitasatospora sp. NPDC048298 TaxID=3364049 RepID=UPI003718EB53